MDTPPPKIAFTATIHIVKFGTRPVQGYRPHIGDVIALTAQRSIYYPGDQNALYLVKRGNWVRYDEEMQRLETKRINAERLYVAPPPIKRGTVIDM